MEPPLTQSVRVVRRQSGTWRHVPAYAPLCSYSIIASRTTRWCVVVDSVPRFLPCVGTYVVWGCRSLETHGSTLATCVREHLADRLELRLSLIHKNNTARTDRNPARRAAGVQQNVRHPVRRPECCTNGPFRSLPGRDGMIPQKVMKGKRVGALLLIVAVLLYGCSGGPSGAKKPNSGGEFLSSVSCVSKTMCVAVGVSKGHKAFSELWNGRAWKSLDAPNPAGFMTVHLDSVSCVAPDVCMAVGGSGQTVANLRPVAEWWNGERWAIESAPAPANSAVAWLGAVDCLSRTVCLATGYHLQSGRPLKPSGIIESWDGSNWRLRAAPNPTSWFALGAISCSKEATCMAIALSRTRANEDWVLSWNGNDWKQQALLAEGGVLQMRFVSCRTTCIVVGNLQGRQYPQTFSIAERWNGRTWSVLPTPDGSQKMLNTVSCVTSQSCMAAGFSGVGQFSLAEWWNGRNWAITSTPKRGASSALDGISCVPAGCMAVGAPNSDGDTGKLLAEWWSGTTWTVTQAT